MSDTFLLVILFRRARAHDGCLFRFKVSLSVSQSIIEVYLVKISQLEA